MSATEIVTLDEPQHVLDTLDHPSLVVSPRREFVTRTVAIIKHHALEHRLDIETRISEAGFEIVKERQMEIDTESDPDTLVELFGPDDAPCFAEGPVWVYILERTHAIRTLLDLLGPADPAIAQQTAPTSLRAQFGISAMQNALAGSASTEDADMQIASLFVSSPPFPPTDLPSDLSTGGDISGGVVMDPSTGSLRSVSSSVLADLRAQGVDLDTTPTSSARHLSKSPSKSPTTGHPRPRVSTTSATSPSSKFKARPAPSTTHAPAIQPRLSRAAAMRTGALPASAPDLPHVKSSPRAPVSKERLAQTFADVPGHAFRTSKIAVGSTKPPAIAPRMTKAASLRVNGPAPVVPGQRRASMGAPSKKTASAEGEKEKEKEKESSPEAKPTFEGVPGHKRRESFTVASTRAPTVAPRLNKAAALRGQKENTGAPPSSFRGGSGLMARSASQGSSGPAPRPSLSRAPSAGSLSGSRGLVHKKSQSLAPPSAFPRATSALSGVSVATNGGAGAGTNGETSPTGVEAPKKPLVRRRSSIAPPAVAPKQNKAAMLRAQKMEAEARERETAAKKAAAAKAVKASRRQTMMV